MNFRVIPAGEPLACKLSSCMLQSIFYWCLVRLHRLSRD